MQSLAFIFYGYEVSYNQLNISPQPWKSIKEFKPELNEYFEITKRYWNDISLDNYSTTIM